MLFEKVSETVGFLKGKTTYRPKVAVILGSGLGDLVDYIEEQVEVDYKDIPNFPVSTVAGHAGKLVFGYSRICVVGYFSFLCSSSNAEYHFLRGSFQCDHAISRLSDIWVILFFCCCHVPCVLCRNNSD